MTTVGRESMEWVQCWRETPARPARAPMIAVPDGLTVGRSIRVMSAGPLRRRHDGSAIQTMTEANLRDMARLVVERASEDPVIIDWGHASSPMFDAHRDATLALSLGLAVGAFVDDDGDGRGPGLYIIPAYTERGLAVVRANAGLLWSSPEFAPREVYARGGAGPPVVIGTAQLLAVALTNRPAQEASAVDHVILTEGGIPAPNPKEEAMADTVKTPETMEPQGMSPDEFTAALQAKDEEIQGLRAYISDMEERVAKAPDVMGEKIKAVALVEDLRAQVTRLSEAVATERSKRERAEDEAAATAWVSDGRISPAEREGFIVALGEKRHSRSAFFEFTFAAREPGAAVPMGEKGHAEVVKPTATVEEADRLIRAYAEEHFGGNYKTAYKHLVSADPNIVTMLNGGH